MTALARDSKLPRIVAAAINRGGKIWSGKRHAEIMFEIWKAATGPDGMIHPFEIPQVEQGFLTDAGEFVNRYQAGGIAFRAGQTKTRYETLLSENLW